MPIANGSYGLSPQNGKSSSCGCADDEAVASLSHESDMESTLPLLLASLVSFLNITTL
ncbi:hypothetical protein Fmac_023340 [Flemingia macrophylla]|uniref:Uncharacterized protein n=1 Tax=Flemingia macrophylla TaxID=520843 RepID=A0ABD1LL78_9FABA